MIKKLFFSLLLYVCITTIYAINTNAAPILVLDALNTKQLPKNFRTSWQSLSNNYLHSQVGFINLHMVGSAQFSELQLIESLKLLKKPVVIIDLRQESHGFINGNAVSWYGVNDWANLNKSSADIQRDEQESLTKAAATAELAILRTKDNGEDFALTKNVRLNLKPQQVIDEAELAKQLGVGYERIYVTDHRAPTPMEVNHFIQFVNKLPVGTTLYFHCRAGVGRTTTFMIMYDMLHNAKQVSYEDIIKRNTTESYNDIVKLPPKNSTQYLYAAKRVEFLKQFYQYASTNQDYYATTWSQWLTQQQPVTE